MYGNAQELLFGSISITFIGVRGSVVIYLRFSYYIRFTVVSRIIGYNIVGDLYEIKRKDT